MLQELFTRDGAGTLIAKDHQEQLSAASIDDVGGILELIAPLEEEGVLVKRSRELLEIEVDRFTVIKKGRCYYRLRGALSHTQKQEQVKLHV